MTSPEATDPPLVIGLLGGVAAGKSTVAAMFGAAGFEVLDADRQAREVVRQGSVREQLVQRFGPEIYGPDGELRRQAVADLVFDDEAARRDLEAITHPAIRRQLLVSLETARTAGRSVVLDAPLLLEGGLVDKCDHAVFVEASATVRRQRASERGWDAAELRRREASQAPLEDKRARCGFTVQNDGDLAATKEQVEQILVQLGMKPT